MKKRNMKKAMAVILAVATVLGLAACGSKVAYDEAQSSVTAWEEGNSFDYAANTGMGVAYDEAEAEMAADEPMEPAPAPAVDNSAYYSERKLIRTVDLDVETKEFDQMIAALETQVAALGGYIENMYTYNGSSYSYRDPARNAHMTARIPKQQLNTFLDTVSNIGNVVSRSENVEDVTLSYVDIESRKEALKVEQERLMDLLKKAESMEDILTIEERLTSVRYQLQSMESQLRTYDNKVDFATVYLSVNEVKELTPVEEKTVWQRIGNGFVDSLRDVRDGLEDFFVWFVVSIPYLIIWAVVITAIVLAVRFLIRRSKKKKAQKQSGVNADTAQEEHL